MTRITYAGSIGHERTLLIRIDDERGSPASLQLLPLFGGPLALAGDPVLSATRAPDRRGWPLRRRGSGR